MTKLRINDDNEKYYGQKFKVVEPRDLPVIGDEKDGHIVTAIDSNINVELEHPSDTAYGYRFVSVEYKEKDSDDPAVFYEFYAVRKDDDVKIIYRIYEDTVLVDEDDFFSDSFTVAGNDNWGEIRWEGDDEDEADEIFSGLEPEASREGDRFRVKGYFLIEEDECECVFSVLRESSYVELIEKMK